MQKATRSKRRRGEILISGFDIANTFCALRHLIPTFRKSCELDIHGVRFSRKSNVKHNRVPKCFNLACKRYALCVFAIYYEEYRIVVKVVLLLLKSFVGFVYWVYKQNQQIASNTANKQNKQLLKSFNIYCYYPSFGDL